MLSLDTTEEESKCEYDKMSTHKEEEIVNTNEYQEEALSEAEAPGQVVLDPLAEPVGTRGTSTHCYD
jgi:hypothetical protein